MRPAVRFGMRGVNISAPGRKRGEAGSHMPGPHARSEFDEEDDARAAFPGADGRHEKYDGRTSEEYWEDLSVRYAVEMLGLEKR